MLYIIIEVECPTGPDVLLGPGSESGRECSGRGICDHVKGFCNCFIGYYGNRCQHQVKILLKNHCNLYFFNLTSNLIRR